MPTFCETYSAQRRWLSDDACAFGERGREAVLAANGEALPPEKKTRYTVPYALSVDVDGQAVSLMFDAWDSCGDLLYRGTDVMFVRDGSIERIVTLNHSSGVCYSPRSSA